MLPNTVGLQSGVELRRADMIFSSFSRQEGGRRRLLIDASASNIDATRAGRPIRWNKPIRLSAALVQDGQRPRLESLQCETNSVSIAGSSDLQTGKFTANGDLGQLLAEVRQVFAVEGFDLAGKFDGEMTWTSKAIDRIGAESWPIEIGSHFQFDNLAVQIPGYDRFVENQAGVTIQGKGITSQNGIERLDAGTLDFISGSDRLTTTLVKPVEQPTTGKTWRVRLDMAGHADSWLARLQPFLPDLGIVATGQIQVSGPAAIDPTHIQLNSAKYELTNLALDGLGMHIREPQVTGGGDMSFDWQKMLLASRDLTLSSSSVAARSSQVQMAFTESGWQLTGAVSYRADVNRVYHWYVTSNDPSVVQWFGEAEGSLQMVPATNSIGGQLTTTIKDLAIAKLQPAAKQQAPGSNPWQVLWQEPTAQLQSTLAIDSNFDQINFEHLAVQSQLVGLDARGSIRDLAKTFTVNFNGHWQPNGPAISQIIKGYVGDQIDVQANSQPQSFVVRGPICSGSGNANEWISPQLVARTSFGWDSARLYGLPVGASSITANLANGVVNLNQPKIPLSEGTVNFNPVIDLRSEPQIVFDKGVLLDSVRLTPEICEGWFKYVAPLLAQATRAQGKFSLSTDGIRMPLFDPLAGSAQGKIKIESAIVQPGPLGQEVIGLANSIKQVAEGQPLATLLQPAAALTSNQTSVLMELPAQEISFEIQDGQIMNRGMTVSVRGVPIRTSGSIGSDASLKLVAEIPVQDDWIKRQPLLASLKGTSLRLPIGGTLSQPKLDKSSIAQLSANLVKQATTQQVESRLNNLIQDNLRDKIPGLNASSDQAANANGSPPEPNLNEALQKSAEQKLQNGLNKLFGPKKE